MSNTLFAGLATLDIQYFVDEFPGANRKVKTEAPSLLVGGPATNAAVAYSFLAGSANLVTSIGRNAFRPAFEHDFKQCKISVTDLAKNDDVQPVLASVVTSKKNGDRTIFTHNPNNLSGIFEVEKLFAEKKPSLLFIDGFYPEVTLELCREAKRQDIPVVFDGGSWKAHLPELLPYIDVAICSNDFMPPRCHCSDDVFAFLAGQGIKQMAISNGGRPIRFVDDRSEGEVPVETFPVTDTLGAGDFLHGAFCYYYECERNLRSALIKSARLASATCQFAGTRTWLSKLEKGAFL